MRQDLHIGLTVAGALLVAALGRSVPRVYGKAMPQVAGENVVAMILGDAQHVFSQAMMDKAEEYFHGGVKVENCTHGLSGGSHVEEAGREGHEHSPGCTCGRDDHDGHREEAAAGGGFPDPWAWMNARVHAQGHRHTEGEDVRELMPWLWAACRISPQNVEAFETSAYVLARMTQRPDEALRLLEEGVRRNPDSASLEFSRGEMLLHSLHDPLAAEAAFEAAGKKCRPAEGPKGDDARFLKGRILFYLGYLANRRGDKARARACLSEAEALNPQHVGTRDLKKLLQRP